VKSYQEQEISCYGQQEEGWGEERGPSAAEQTESHSQAKVVLRTLV
jgi:hypothetical protein